MTVVFIFAGYVVKLRGGDLAPGDGAQITPIRRNIFKTLLSKKQTSNNLRQRLNYKRTCC